MQIKATFRITKIKKQKKMMRRQDNWNACEIIAVECEW